MGLYIMTTTTSLLVLASLFAVTSFGCAAAPTARPGVPEASGAQHALDAAADVDPEMAERTFAAMSARCRQDPRDRSESTRNHCIAATHLALKVLHDTDRAEALLAYRCEKFGARDRNNARCAVTVQAGEARDGGY